MNDASYTDAGSLAELFEYLRLRVGGLRQNSSVNPAQKLVDRFRDERVLECLLSSLANCARSLSVPPPWCPSLTESDPCQLVLETAAGRHDPAEVRVKVWSRHPPYGDNLAEYLEPRCRNSEFGTALNCLATDLREFNIVVDEPPSGYPKIFEPPLPGRVRRTMTGIFVEASYGELIPAERFGVRVPTDAERAALRNGPLRRPDAASPKLTRKQRAARRAAKAAAEAEGEAEAVKALAADPRLNTGKKGIIKVLRAEYVKQYNISENGFNTRVLRAARAGGLNSAS